MQSEPILVPRNRYAPEAPFAPLRNNGPLLP